MILYSFILLQAYDSSSSSSMIVELLVGLLICFGVFLLLRIIMLWYWKVDVIVRNQEEQIRLLKQSFEQENRRNARVNYYKYITLGDRQQAYEALVYVIYYDLTAPGIKEEDKREKYEKAKSIYLAKFEAIGYEFPPYPF